MSDIEKIKTLKRIAKNVVQNLIDEDELDEDWQDEDLAGEYANIASEDLSAMVGLIETIDLANLTRLTAENERLREQLRWRKCSEEMPPANELVLIYHKPRESHDIGCFDPEIPTASGGWCHQWDDPSVVPTHWQPLTPPEAQQ